MNIIFDIDETLIRKVEYNDIIKNENYHLNEKSDQFIEINDIFYKNKFIEKLESIIVVRNHILMFMIFLIKNKDNILILSNATQEYCDLVWDYLKGLLYEEVDKVFYEQDEIKKAIEKIPVKSSRDEPKKNFKFLDIPEKEWDKTVVIDNYRGAWEKSLLNHVIIIPDFDPFKMGIEDCNTIVEINNIIKDLKTLINFGYNVSECLSEIYERKIKTYMIQNNIKKIS